MEDNVVSDRQKSIEAMQARGAKELEKNRAKYLKRKEKLRMLNSGQTPTATPASPPVTSSVAPAVNPTPVAASAPTPSGPSTRRARASFNGTEAKLKVNAEIPGYHLHIFNDTPGRIDHAVEVGYEFVSPQEVGGVGNNVVSRNTDIGGDKVRFLVGKAEDGGPLYAYLMKQKEEWYLEDQAELTKKNNMIDDALRRGKAPGVSSEGFYVPRDGIKLS